MYQKLGRDVLIHDNSLEDCNCDALVSLYNYAPQSVVTLNEASGHYSGATEYDALDLTTKGFKYFSQFITKRLEKVVSDYRAEFDIAGSVGTLFSTPELMCFRKDKGQIIKHVDSNGPDHDRSLAIIWYLNSVEDGGVLTLPSADIPISVSPLKGRLVVFPCDWTHYHFVTPVISEDRFSLMTFLKYEK